MKTYIFFILSTTILFACSGRKKIADGEKIKNHSPKYLIDSMKLMDVDVEWLRTKATTIVNFQGEKTSVRANIRMRKDSGIWVNLSKSSVPLLTAVLSQDSVKFLKKINGKEYFLGNYNEINNLLNLELNYMLLQDFISGKPIMFDYEGKFKSHVEEGQYLLSSDKSKKIDKLLEKGRGNSKHDILYRCWIEPSNYKCSKVQINFLSDSTNLEVYYSDWMNVGGNLFPEKSTISFTTPYDTIFLDMKYSNKMKVNEPQNMPFTISENYSPFKLNEDD